MFQEILGVSGLILVYSVFPLQRYFPHERRVWPDNPRDGASFSATYIFVQKPNAYTVYKRRHSMHSMQVYIQLNPHLSGYLFKLLGQYIHCTYLAKYQSISDRRDYYCIHRSICVTNDKRTYIQLNYSACCYFLAVVNNVRTLSAC